MWFQEFNNIFFFLQFYRNWFCKGQLFLFHFDFKYYSFFREIKVNIGFMGIVGSILYRYVGGKFENVVIIFVNCNLKHRKFVFKNLSTS